MKLETILDSLINGQREQAAKQIKAYRVRKFLLDYPDYLEQRFSKETAFKFLKDAIICVYH